MSTTTDIGAAVSPLAAAQARAVDDAAFAAMLKEAGKAGAILGVGTNAKTAGAFFTVLADEIASPALVILGLRSADDGQDGSDKLPTAEAAPTVLLQLCGLVNNAIEHAQAEARRSAVRRMKAAEMSKAAKNARNAVITRMDRALSPYGVSVNFSAATCAERELSDVKTDAEKACDRVVSAFALDVRGALDGLAALDAQAWTFVVARVSRLNAERDAESADENAAALQATADELAAKALKAEGPAKPVADEAAKTAAAQAATARARADRLAAALKKAA